MGRGFKLKDLFNEVTLMAVASVGAFCIGEYLEGIAVLLFYFVGEALQHRAVKRAKGNIQRLLDIRPDQASVVTPSGMVRKAVEEVAVGDEVEVKVGERVPLDGTLLGGCTSFNTAALTGESVPRKVECGGEVLAGMIATDRVVRLKVLRRSADSALSRILRMVEDAAERKAPAETFIRKFARYYTPAVVGLAFLIVLVPFACSVWSESFFFDFDSWLYRALVFLVVSCPCALVISVPLSYFGGIGAASKCGILFKGGNYLDAIAKVNTVVFDKTGTLTKGIFAVQQIRTAGWMDEDEMLATVAAVERGSNHPIAKAVVECAAERGVRFDGLPVGQVEERAGYGLDAKVGNRTVLVGNLKLLRRNGIKYPAELDDIQETAVVCAADGKFAGLIVVSDSLKDDAEKAVKGLGRVGISDVVVLSGDRTEIVRRLAERLGISRYFGDLLPEGKVEQFERLKSEAGRTTAFVGDGINDAPVLALSDVGIAMGGLGSDAAIETADVVIQTDQPSKVVSAIRIGRMTRRIVWQNIALALSVKFAVMSLGLFGVATMWEAVFADTGVTLLAILNTFRIQRFARLLVES